ncbi:hypothetical protein [Mycobacterium persicum]|uniref:Uncharacterized protein n=1 Tax=Mycobacterium persicum TaxID=1487726 RepID=A0A1X0LCG7_9MYCO|nr:hypothetical protein [Mycobacterium persicum]ORB48048.1 hypothetical protein BST40_14400 [Mycobacterium persicum]ORB91163.1 hypothetical protein B1T49_20170 [Mycobacterium persicum]ORB96459.1 hypothetical protein B1T44_20370 [Mycobacterium persicum]ORC08620.1 hypothetical protein B4U45_20495 [Mycobacterium persicum]VAZ71387.1 hypothetical protein LAUMK15_00812 [Mycobacterium persicum]
MAEATPDADTTDTGNNGDQPVPLHERPEFIAWLTASCERQNLPVTVTDPAVIARIATLLGIDHRPSPAGYTRQTGRTRSMSRRRAPGVPGAMTA